MQQRLQNSNNMSYQVLARKWRPRNFHEMVGQEHVLKALVNALDHGRLHHAYLFTGTRGVGKTTIARILAKSLNCETGISSEPCGQCSACVEINEGRFIDLIEVDAASRTKVEDTRELLENVQYAPTRGRYKVYLIDEVHMLSGHSFNALLKTLEEPPPHVKFLLATTDPQKLPITILSRCLQFSLKAMTPERIVGHLKKVLDAELVGYEEPALWQLGRAADGSMRDALSLTDQAIAFGSGKIVESDVRAMLGSIDREFVFGIVDALAAGEATRLLQTVAEMAEQSPDYMGVLADLISTLHRMAVAQLAPDAVDDSDGDRQRVLEQSARFAAEQLQLFYQTALLGRRDLPLAPDARSGFEMILLRMLMFKPQVTLPTGVTMGAGASPVGKPERAAAAGPTPRSAVETVNALTEEMPVRAVGNAGNHLDQMRALLGGEAKPGAIRAGVAQPLPSSSNSGQNVVSMPQRENPRPVQQVTPGPVSVNDEAVPVKSRQAAMPGQAPQATTKKPLARVSAAPAPRAPILLGDEWSDLIAQLELDGPVRNFARNAALDSRQDSLWQLVVGPRFEALYREENCRILQDAITAKIGQPVTLKVEFRESGKPTPDQLLAQRNQQLREQAVELIQQDAFVQMLQTEFGATLDLKSVTPLDE